VSGKGTHGEVFLARDTLNNGRYVAVKAMSTVEEDEGLPVAALRELSLIQHLSSAYVIRLYEGFCEQGELFMVVEGMQRDLRTHYSTRKLTPYETHLLVSQLLSGLDHMRSRRILHRDIKPQNILVNDRGHLKIGDFGLARLFVENGRTLTCPVCTLWYRPLDVCLGNDAYGFELDAWSAGCTIYELVHGEVLFRSNNEWEQIICLISKLGTPPIERRRFKHSTPLPNMRRVFEDTSPYKEIIEGLTQALPQDRLSVADALSRVRCVSLSDQVAQAGGVDASLFQHVFV
jgi:serine/threonine protein kinase